MAKYAKGKYAFGYCDRSGFRYPINELVPESVQGRPAGIMVGVDEVDEDNPQEWLGRLHLPLPDAMLLRKARPDAALIQSRAMWSWAPVGVGNLEMTASVGRATVP